MRSKTNNQLLFSADLNWTSGNKGIVSSQLIKPSICITAPPEFGGEGTDWSPEHLFLSSVSSCFMLTFLVFAKKINVEISGFECATTGQVEMIDGRYKFTYIHLYPKAFVANEADIEKAKVAMEKAKKYCLISNSVNAEIMQHPEVAIAKQHAVINSAA